MINLSIETGSFPDSLKQALLSPIIKKQGLDPDILNNYRPISKLPFISIECAVTQQLTSYLDSNHLLEPNKSVYHKFHSTETTILYVLIDLLVLLDNKNTVYISLLDCSTAFDLVDHNILLQCLQTRLGITDQALLWFKSYSSDWTQCGNISCEHSSPQPLSCGVPQGSVLGPVLFSIYTLPLGDIIWSHDAGFHLYADDTQLYLACDHPNSHIAQCEIIARLEACIADIQQWMPLNGLKLNDGKTEFLAIHSKHKIPASTPTILIGQDEISAFSTARNLGVIFDTTLSLCPHISSVVKVTFFQLRRIACVRRFLTLSATKTLVHSLMSSHLDYCNSVLAGLPDVNIMKLQTVENAAAHLWQTE